MDAGQATVPRMVDPAGPRPEIAVVVASHDRPLRLRWLLNALEEQTLAARPLEVVVAHDSARPETEQLLDDHPLARDGMLRHVRSRPGVEPAGANRNAAWRAARAPIVAFTDDDCRPPREWLANALRAAAAPPRRHRPGRHPARPRRAPPALRARPPRAEHRAARRPGPRRATSSTRAPCSSGWTASTSDVAPGEDADLAPRARAAGVAYVGAPEVLTYHAVEAGAAAPARLRVACGVARPAALSSATRSCAADFPLGIFWKRSHALPLAAPAAPLLARRTPPRAGARRALGLDAAARRYGGRHARPRLRACAELPGRAVDRRRRDGRARPRQRRATGRRAVSGRAAHPVLLARGPARRASASSHELADGLPARGHQPRLITSHPGRTGDQRRGRACPPRLAPARGAPAPPRATRTT